MIPQETFDSVLSRIDGSEALAKGFLFLVYAIRNLDKSGNLLQEQSSSLRYFLASRDGVTLDCSADLAAEIIRGLRHDRVKKTAPQIQEGQKLRYWEKSMILELRKAQLGQPIGIFPLTAV